MGRALVQGGFIGPDVLSLKTRELGCGAGDWEADWAEYSSNHHPRLNTGLCSVLNTIEKSAETVIAETPLCGPTPGRQRS